MANDIGTRTTTQDAIGVEVFANLFKAVVDEMAWVVLRSSHTTFVKETRISASRSSPPRARCSPTPMAAARRR